MRTYIQAYTYKKIVSKLTKLYYEEFYFHFFSFFFFLLFMIYRFRNIYFYNYNDYTDTKLSIYMLTTPLK